MYGTREVVLLPPQPSDLDDMALLADVQFLEPFSSEALNRKFLGIVPPGIYRGMGVAPGGGLSVSIGGSGGTAVANVEGVSITVQQQYAVNLPVEPGFSGFIALQAVYGLGVITTQVSKDSTIKAAEFIAIKPEDVRPKHVILCSISVPVDATEVLPEHISSDGRQAVDLSGLKYISGGKPGEEGKVITHKTCRNSELNTLILLHGEVVVTDEGRISVGVPGSSLGGVLQPAATFTPAQGETALPQGWHHFTADGVLMLGNAKNGECVDVSSSVLLPDESECYVQRQDGAPIVTKLGAFNRVRIERGDRIKFIREQDQWTA